MPRTWRSLLFIFLLAVATVGAHAQTTQQFTGHVTDIQGAVIPDAEVTVHNVATGIETKSVTTGVGVYTIPYLQPATYDITVTKPGFKTEVKTGVLLYIDQTSTIDFKLSVGATNEEIKVDASAVQIELSKADRGEIIDAERVAELPLDSRNVYQLFGLSPGTHNFSSNQYPRPFDNVTDNMYANGSPQQPSLSLDGISNDSGGSKRAGFGTNPGIIPSVDAVGEFKVVLGALDASYGQGGGASMDLGLKTGTNRIHGVLDYYKRAAWLDTYTYQSKYNAFINNAPAVKSQHARSQYSLEFDGPVVIPHVFNGKDKLFFTVNYEYMKDVLPDNFYSYSSVPNPAWLTGNFGGAQFFDQTTQTLQPLVIYDVLTPLHPVIDPNDPNNQKPKLAHSPFPNNVIPANRIDPTGAAMLNYLSGIQPNYNPGPGNTPYSNNYANLAVEHDIWKNGLVKVDYVMSDTDRFSFHWSGQGRWQQDNNGPGWPTSAKYYNQINNVGKQIEPKAETGTIQWTHTFSPTLLFDAHATLITTENARQAGATVNTPSILASLALDPVLVGEIPDYNRFPYISWGGTTIGPNSLGDNWRTHALDFLPTVTYIRGQHSIRAGLDIQLQQAANLTIQNSNWTFSNNFTNEFYGYSEATGYTSGSSYASGLLGYMNSGNVPVSAKDFESQHYFAPWVQDDWKVTRKLTLNLGLRWDFQQPRTVRNNAVNGPFLLGVTNPIPGSTLTLTGTPTYAGVNGIPAAGYAMNRLEWQPRVGVAYAIKPTLSLRAFIAKNYPINSNINGNFGFSNNTPYTNSVVTDPVLGALPYTVNDGFGNTPGLSKAYSAIAQPVGSSLGYLSNVGNSWTWLNPHYRGQDLWNYNVTLEAALTKRDTISASYVGNYTGDQPVTDNVNHPNAAAYNQCNGETVGWTSVVNGVTVPTHQVCDNQSINGQLNTLNYAPNPFKGLPEFHNGSGYYGNANVNKAGDLSRPYFGWYDLNEQGITNNGRNWYNAGTLSLKHQATNNLSLYFNYTHAKAISAGGWNDTTYRIISRQVSTTNTVKHAINASGVIYLPFGRNRQFFSGVNRVVDEAINGWEFSPIIEYYSGFPWRPNIPEWNTPVGLGVKKFIVQPDGTHHYRRIQGVTTCVGSRNSDTGGIIPSPAMSSNCPATPYYVTQGSYAVPRNIVDYGVTQPGATRFDAAVSKNFAIPWLPKRVFTEATNLQLRVDLLNAFNHPTWDEGYDSNVGDNTFGSISKGPSAQTNAPRYLQLSGRLNW